jgi:dolichol-phosphate mannosyltransferase
VPNRLSVVLPAFAEEDSLHPLVGRLHELVGDELREILLILSPKSPAKTQEIAKQVAQRYSKVRVMVQKETPGVGCAFREGILEARGELLLLMDSDGEMDVETVPKLLRALDDSGADLVVGSRWAPGGGAEGYDNLKYVLNRGFQYLFRALYLTRVTDLTFGFKLGRTAAIQSLRLSAQFQEIGAEVTLAALRRGLRVVEIPTVWRMRKAGTSTNPLSRNFRYVKVALSVFWQGAR